MATPLLETDLDGLYYADEPEDEPLPRRKVPAGDVYEAARAGDVHRLKILLEQGVNVNARDAWDSVALYYACLAGHLDAAQMLLESGAICSEHTFDGDRCHYAALNLRVRRLLKSFEARPPPLDPLPSSLRDLFISSGQNWQYFEGSMIESGKESYGAESVGYDITFYLEGKSLSAHRWLLAARSPFFKSKFEKEWKSRKWIRFTNKKLTFSALFSLINFFYTDRLDVAVEDMQDLARICKVCGCIGLRKVLQKELNHQKFAQYKYNDVDDSQKRFMLQGSSLPVEERLPAAMHRLFRLCLLNSSVCVAGKESKEVENAIWYSDEQDGNTAKIVLEMHQKRMHFVNKTATTTRDPQEESLEWDIQATTGRSGYLKSTDVSVNGDHKLEVDHADICVLVGGMRFRCHSAFLAARSDYFKARIRRTTGFLEGVNMLESDMLQGLEEHDLNVDTYKKMLEYIYTDTLEDIELDQAEEMFDAASRYLLFSLKRAVADVLIPQLETAKPAELCHWLLVADMYGVSKLREYCLDCMAINFEIFAATANFRKMLHSLPPPSGDSSERTSAPSAPGQEDRDNEENILDDLREKWLEAEGAELNERDASAKQFDKMLEYLVALAEDDLITAGD